MTIHHTDAVRCAEAIVDAVGRDIVLAIPVGAGKPNLLANALYGLALADRRIKLGIFTGLSLVRPRYKSTLEQRFVAPLLDRLFSSWPDLAYAEAMRDGGLPPNVTLNEFFLQAGQWLANPQMQQSYASLNYSHVAAHLQRIGVIVFAQLVAPDPGGRRDRLSLSANTDVTLDMAGYVAARRASGAPIAIVGELNANLPYMPGAAEVDAAQFDLLFDPPAPHFALFAPPKEPVALADYAMALHTSTLVKDGGTLQIGIGSFADAVTHALILRHTRNAEYRRLLADLGEPLHPQAELEPFTQGLYGSSEMLVDGFLALRRAGILKRRVPATTEPGETRRAIVHAGFFLGSKGFYQELREMPRADLEEIVMSPISFTNTMHGDTAAKAAQRPHARFVNTGMMATLLGAVSSDGLDDGRVVSGIGGQADFVLMGHDLPGARSILSIRASRAGGGGRRSSNIVWSYGNCSIPRQLRDIIVTEYGIADIRGAPDGVCVEAMLRVSDSAFQPGLQAAAERATKLRRGYQLPASARDNRPEKITAALSPWRAKGLLPMFPLGTEMTETEQALIPSLAILKRAGPLDFARLLARGWSGEASAEQTAALARLQLAEATGWRDRLLRALMLGAMRR